MSTAHKTEKGTPYLTGADVSLVARTTLVSGLTKFISGFDKELGYDDYLQDEVALAPYAQRNQAGFLSKIAGQLCYLSFGKNRTKNAGLDKYIEHIRSSGHGSVLEHGSATFLLWGIDRSCTHELVRHRAGMAYSQVSQRYVGGKSLRFVERKEWQTDHFLHQHFCDRIDRAAEEYELLTDRLVAIQTSGEAILTAERRTDEIKKVRQAARACLPNETEAPIIVTGNHRAWRHFLNMRASKYADLPIREAAMLVYDQLMALEPAIYADFKAVALDDGTLALETQYPKV